MIMGNRENGNGELRRKVYEITDAPAIFKSDARERFGFPGVNQLERRKGDVERLSNRRKAISDGK